MCPQSTKKLYEAFAKRLLENYFPCIYKGLEMSDKPDLRMGDCRGVEVTRALFSKDEEARSYFLRIKSQHVKRIPKESIIRFSKLGYKLLLHNAIVIGYTKKDGVSFDGTVLKEAFYKKCSKPYVTHAECSIDLFLFTSKMEIFDDGDAHCFNEWLVKNNKFFSRVIVFNGSALYFYDTQQRDLIIARVDTSNKHILYEEAKAIANSKNTCIDNGRDPEHRG